MTQGSLALIKVTPALPPVTYVAMYKGEHRSSLLASIITLAQECCDFTRHVPGRQGRQAGGR